MRRSTLKSTTSLVMSAALAAAPVFAQEADAPLEVCQGFDDPAAFAANELLAETPPEITFPCADLDGGVIADQAAFEAAIIAAADTDEVVVEEAPVVAEELPEGDDAAAQAELPQVEEDAAAVEEVPDADDIVEQAEPEVDETIIEEVEEPQVDDNEADVAVEESAPEVAVEEAPEDNAAVVEEAEVPQTDESDPQVATEELPEGNDDVEQADLPQVDDSEAAEELSQDEASVAQEEPTPVEETPAAAAGADVEMSDDVEVQTLTEEDVRSSDEDFETSATQAPAARAADEDDNGSSDFEKALLIGLGAVVVGSVLNNGDEVVSNSGDRVVVQRGDDLVVLKDDDVLLRQPGSQLQTQTFDDGSTRTIVTREDGSQIMTIRGREGRVLRRTRILTDGTEVLLFDDTQEILPVIVTDLPPEPENVTQQQISSSDVDQLRDALLARQNDRLTRTYSLRQVREIREVRVLAPEVELDVVTFASGSAAIDPTQAEELGDLGFAIRNIVADDPRQVFLIEGHTDAVGDAGYNLALSDRRAETVALALTEYFDVPPENLITQGYGESILKVQTQADERANRRASVRNISSLLQ